MKDLKGLRKEFMSETKEGIKLELEQAIRSGLSYKKDLINISSKYIFRKNENITLELINEMKLKYTIIEDKIYIYIGEDEKGFDKSVDIMVRNIERIKMKINSKKKTCRILNVIGAIGIIMSLILTIARISKSPISNWGVVDMFIFIISIALLVIGDIIGQSYEADIINLDYIE